jgi:hypothetical protein
MTYRAWILALGAGLCASLPACQTVGSGAPKGDSIVAAPADPQPKPTVVEAGSPYAVIPLKEKKDDPARAATLQDDSIAYSPYGAVPQQSPPSIPSKAAPVTPESKLASILPASMQQTAKVAVAAPPPPPDPPTWDEDLPAPTPYAASRNQAPIPAPHFNLGSATTAEPVSPYAAPANQNPTANPIKAPASGSTQSSPYPMILNQGAGVSNQGSGVRSQETGVRGQESGVRSQPRDAESLSPYAEVPNTSPTLALTKSGPATQPILESATSKTPASLKTNDSSSPAAKADSDPQIQQTNRVQEMTFRATSEAPTVSTPEVGLDLLNEVSAGVSGDSNTRRNDEPPIVTALRCFLNKRPAEAINWLKRYDEANQELLMRFLPLISPLTVRDLTRADADKGTEILEDLQNLLCIHTDRDLVIGKLCLCKHIKTFGDYEPFPLDHQFQPRDLVWIYAEVRNFTSERRDLGNGDLVYETRLRTTARITNYGGTREWPLPFDRRCGPDQSRSLRRDYWDNLSFNVPELPPGGYTLWLKVVDEPTGRFKERSVDFQVVPTRGS